MHTTQHHNIKVAYNQFPGIWHYLLMPSFFIQFPRHNHQVT